MVSGRYNRIKGHTFEREVAALFREALGDDSIRRTLQTRGGAQDGADVVAGPFHIECKRQKKPRIVSAYEQAVEATPKGGYSVAITQGNRCLPLVTLSLDDFLELVTELWELRGQ